MHRRKVDLTEAGTGAAGQQPQVDARLGELDRDPLEDSGELDERADVLGGLDEIAGRRHRYAGDLGKVAAGQCGIRGMGGEAGADGRATEVDLADEFARLAQAPAILVQHEGEGGEFLTEGHENGVLELGASDLEDVGELLSLGGEGLLQQVHGVQQAVGGHVQCHVDGGRVDVVGALPRVHVLQGVQVLVGAPRVAE